MSARHGRACSVENVCKSDDLRGALLAPGFQSAAVVLDV
jgi:hypothetical protein